ncbi:MAG: MarR family winged helix-turn-helix transcriptional regulator [Acidimicrobiales bacterium]
MSTEPVSRPGRVAARLSRQVELALAEVELSLPQYRLLFLLAEGRIAASALADRLAVSRPSVTAVVDGLVSRGLVERQPDPDDRRLVRHELTPAGRGALDAADTAVDERLRAIASHIEGREGAAFGELGGWRSALDAYRLAKVAAVR